jgi:hypothetical protein
MNDDDWMPHPVNYTPWFKWYIKQQEKKKLINKIDDAITKIERKQRQRDFYLDLYLVSYSRGSKTWVSNYQLIQEFGFEAVYEDD